MGRELNTKLHLVLMACRKPSSLVCIRLVVSAAMLLIVRRAAAAAGTGGTNEIHLHFYMHDVVTGRGATAVEVVNGTGPRVKRLKTGTVRFGEVVVMDDLLTEGASRASKAVGRAQGFYVFASLDGPALLFSMNVVLTAGPYNGSTVAVVGRDDFLRQAVRELPVVGGTGRFRMASGYMLLRTASSHGKNVILEIDVFIHVCIA